MTPRNIIDRATGGIAWFSRKRRVHPPQGVVKVNLGSGLTLADGWIHVDVSLNAFLAGWPKVFLRAASRYSGSRRWISAKEYVRLLKRHRFIHHDVRFGIPFQDTSVDYLFTSHLLEHLYKDQADALLRDAYRTLKKDAPIRICVPDLAHAIDLYRAGKKEKSLEYFFSDEGSARFGRHRYMYNFDMLRSRLKEAGFTRIRRCRFQQGEVPDLDQLDNREEETLYVEAAP